MTLPGGLILAVPPVAVSAGLFVVLRWVADPFALAIPLIILVNALMALPFALAADRAAADPLRRALRPRLPTASASAGSARIRLVDWPLLARPLAAAFAVAVALSLGDLGVAAFFGSGNILTLPLLLYQRMGAYRMAESASVALLLSLLVLGAVPRRAKMVGGAACSKPLTWRSTIRTSTPATRLSVPAGALCGLIGPSGGGKTTLLHAIAGFETPTSGTLRFAGRDLLRLTPARAAALDPVPGPQSLPASDGGAECRARHRPALRLDAAGHAAVAGALARVGLDGLGGRRPAELSGGQRQRVAIARALVRRRPLMLLDEPFGGLDPGLRQEMIALVDALRRDEGLTVLVSIHTPEDLGDAAELMAFVADGRVLAAAPPQEILSAGFHPAIDRYLGR